MLKLIQLQNIDQIQPLFKSKLAQELGDEFIESMQEYVDKREYVVDWEVFLLTFENQVIGVCGLYSEHSPAKNFFHEYWLGWLGVHQDYRNKGYGIYMVQQMEAMAKSYGAKRFLVHCIHDKIPFYEKNGFVEVLDTVEVDRYINETTSECSEAGFSDSIMRKDI